MPERPAGIQANILLGPATTLKIGGPAEYFLAAKTVDEIVAAVTWARQERLRWTILGAGSNCLVSDRGVKGLVIVTKCDGFTWEGDRLIAETGMMNGQLVAVALANKRGGLRWLVGVPGTVGGSIYGNAGGHGWGLGDQVEWVEVLHEDSRVGKINQHDCGFHYRQSIFKTRPDVILRVALNLPPVDPTRERLLIAETAAQKNAAQPTAEQSAGCMFMNPTVDPARLPTELRSFVLDDRTISAWRLIAYLELAGQTIGRMQISTKHANFMVNLGGGTADQVVQLISLVKQRVRDTLNVQLHEEVQYIGF